MLTELCQELRNWFDRGLPKYVGRIDIENGAITNVNFLKSGQYFRIIGSLFNDGVHKLDVSDKLTDEEFVGSIWAMAVPPAVIALSNEIDAWTAKYDDVINSPYQSESFDGYSYQKRGSGYDSNSTNGSGWKSIFKDKLNRWRKI